MKIGSILPFLLVLVLVSCQKNRDIKPIEKESTLIVEWKDRKSDTHAKENAMMYLYDSEEAWQTPYAEPVASASLADIRPTGGGTIMPVNSATFKGLAPRKYWVKIINAYNHDALIEHNQNLPHILQTPLNRGTITTTAVRTEAKKLTEYRLKNLTITALPEFKANPNKSVKVTFMKFYPSGYAGPEPTYYFQQVVSTNDFPLSINLDVSIREFNSWWYHPYFYIYIEPVDFYVYKAIELNLFDMIIANKGLYGQLLYKDQNKNIVFTIKGDWVTK